MFKRKRGDISFYSVALFIIALGILIFTFGMVTWLFNVFGDNYTFVQPSSKVIGGAVVIALGYIQLELELMRKG